MTDRFWELMARNWSGNIAEEERAELERYLLEHPEYWLKAGLEKRLDYKAGTPLSASQAGALADDVLARIQAEEAGEPAADVPGRVQADEAGEPAESNRSRVKRSVALMLAVLIGGAFTWYLWKPAMDKPLKEIATIPGMKTSINLGDGTTVWLNAGSKLRYPEVFNRQDNIREVFLEGEGYFQVKQQAGKPFIIHTSTMDVKVLGTTLNVRAYADEDFSETALVNGAVMVTVQGKDFYLKPREKVIVRKKGDAAPAGGLRKTPTERISLEPIRGVSDSLLMETAWREEKLVFQDETFAALALRLERWYGVKITIHDPALRNSRFSGRADNVSLEQLLSILNAITPFNYDIKEREVIIQ